MKISYNQASDSIEFVLKDIEGIVQPTTSPFIIEKVDSEKNIVSISVLGVSTFKQQKKDLELLDIPQPAWTDYKLWYEMKG